MQTYFAHSENDAGERHLLRDHLLGVLRHINSFTCSDSLRDLTRSAALLHDLGKYLHPFQNYLLTGGKRGSIPHAKWGAIFARCLGLEEASFAIDGHHAGLPDYSVWANEHTFADGVIKNQLQDLVSSFIQDTGITEEELLELRSVQKYTPRDKDIVTRLIFSCLTDADWLDTEEHFTPNKSSRRNRQTLDLDSTIELIENNFAALATDQKTINTLRTEARLEALEKSHLSTGFFSLTLPTGLGKTLTSFRWALEHAKANQLERIIIVLPYTNIIDQTASQLKKILGSEKVLEHHSSYLPCDSERETENTKTLACENWDYPVIVTTTVQFFETLFSNSRGKCRKLHNISKAVVILDEVQTLPKELVLPTLDMLQDMQKIMGTSFVFCTATMPSFKKQGSFDGLGHITELIKSIETFFKKTQRVSFNTLNDLNPVAQACLQEEINSQQKSTLVICNTKRMVRELYEEAEKTGEWDKVYHLSTSMCPDHRKKNIGEITEHLKDKNSKILVLSTQLVEAGVDLDFPCVFREIAPLESIIQAAGRCNREGSLPCQGQVIIFQVEDANYPDQFYKTQATHTSTLISKNLSSIYDYTFFKNYYAQIMNLFVKPLPITKSREEQNFATTSNQYKIIANNTSPIFIWNYSDKSRELYEKIKTKEKLKIPLSRDDFRDIQQYSVQLYENNLHQTAGLWEESSGILFWNGSYCYKTGLDVEKQYSDNLIM